MKNKWVKNACVFCDKATGIDYRPSKVGQVEKCHNCGAVATGIKNPIPETLFVKHRAVVWYWQKPKSGGK